jgi:amino acid permease
MREAVIYAVLILLSVVVLWLALRLKPVEWRAALVVLGITLLSLLYWFWMAPSLRFSGALFWLLIVSGLLLLYDQLRQIPAVRSPHMLLAFMLLLLMFWLSPDFKSVSMRTMIVPPLERAVAAEQMLGDPTQYQETDSGLKVFIAAGEADELCWDMPLPCVRLADFDPRLALIDPADMRKGFYIAIDD